MDARVRITVLERSFERELLRELSTEEWTPCARLREGDEFISVGANMPEGFCSWAWCDIQKYVVTLARGGNFLGVRPGVFVTCCTDGFRPVRFKLERIEQKGS